MCCRVGSTTFLRQTNVAIACPLSGAAALTDSSSPVLDWIANEGIIHLAIHFDLDVLDPSTFRPLLFNKPGLPPDVWQECPGGG
jgi:hypothetical protein